MGSNIHIVKGNSDQPLDIPEELGCGNSCTLPRYEGSYLFMKLVWDNCETIKDCCCDVDNHYYGCLLEARDRPKDFTTLREGAMLAGLGDVFFKLIDYLESEPNAWLEYD